MHVYSTLPSDPHTITFTFSKFTFSPLLFNVLLHFRNLFFRCHVSLISTKSSVYKTSFIKLHLHSLSQQPPKLQTTKMMKQIPGAHQPPHKILLRIQIQLKHLSLNSHTDSSLLSPRSLILFSSSVPIALLFLVLNQRPSLNP